MKTTKRDFDLFKEFARKWQKKLSLTGWAIYFYHEKLEDEYASSAWHMSGRAATLKFSTKWDIGREFSEAEIERLALHEILHIFFASLIYPAESRYTTQEDIDTAEHSIIRCLEDVLL